jgi:hypothetical protein
VRNFQASPQAEIAALGDQVELGAGLDTDGFDGRLRQPQPETVSPFGNLHFHRVLTGYTMYIQ